MIDSGIGKSSILLRYTDGGFDPEHAATIGIDFKAKTLDVGGSRVRLNIWDTAGQERFKTMSAAYYRGAAGIIFGYDVTREITFEHLQQWIEEADAYTTSEHVVKMLVGNKIDLESEREVSRDRGADFARKHQMMFIEASAKTEQGVAQAFEELTQKCMDTPELLEDAQGRGGGGGGAGADGGGLLSLGNNAYNAAADSCGC